MASKPDDPPETLIIPAFMGVRNTVSPERLAVGELERALNVDIDNVGQLRRRRGFVLKLSGSWHSATTIGATAYGVRDGRLGIVRPNYSFVDLAPGGDAPISYANVGADIYYSSDDVSGRLVDGETPAAWGETGGDRTWYSPVITPTETLGEVAGKLLGKPPLAQHITYFNGRMWLARGKTLWATELFLYNYVDKTRTFFQFEDEITMLQAVDDGIYVGTLAAVYFLAGDALAAMKRKDILAFGAIRGSAVVAPADAVHPQARQGDFPLSNAVVFKTEQGVCAGFRGGECYNLTRDRVVFPAADRAAALFRSDSGANHYIAVANSAGTPSSNARIGDYVEAEIRRFTGG